MPHLWQAATRGGGGGPGGAAAELVVVEGVGHYQTAALVPRLAEAAPWLEARLAE